MTEKKEPLPHGQEWAKKNLFPLFIPCDRCGYRSYCDEDWVCRIKRKKIKETKKK